MVLMLQDECSESGTKPAMGMSAHGEIARDQPGRPGALCVVPPFGQSTGTGYPWTKRLRRGMGERSGAVLQTGRNRPPENSGLIPLSLLRAVRQLAAYYRVSPDQLAQRDVEDFLMPEQAFPPSHPGAFPVQAPERAPETWA